eukprot:767051-Hanusia_phi.AAC.13
MTTADGGTTPHQVVVQFDLSQHVVDSKDVVDLSRAEDENEKSDDDGAVEAFEDLVSLQHSGVVENLQDDLEASSQNIPSQLQASSRYDLMSFLRSSYDRSPWLSSWMSGRSLCQEKMLDLVVIACFDLVDDIQLPANQEAENVHVSRGWFSSMLPALPSMEWSVRSEQYCCCDDIVLRVLCLFLHPSRWLFPSLSKDALPLSSSLCSHIKPAGSKALCL